ncbi:hypothetical protein W823_20030 [Williamsia sp. D3]|nr:hypothetical protein W823_20030 [Williamsia sp. D3]
MSPNTMACWADRVLPQNRVRSAMFIYVLLVIGRSTGTPPANVTALTTSTKPNICR